MANKIRADDLAGEISKALNSYIDDVKVNSQEVAIAVAKSTAEKLKQSSPQKSGRYRRNWTSEGYDTGAIVYNKAPTYRLTHLLEKGHAKKNGGRTAPQPHIAPVEEKAIQEYEQELLRRLEN